jgi:hypothetical protein
MVAAFGLVARNYACCAPVKSAQSGETLGGELAANPAKVEGDGLTAAQLAADATEMKGESGEHGTRYLAGSVPT